MKIYKLPLDKEVEDSIDSRYGLFSYLPAMDPLPIVARIYVISAVNLHPMDTNGKVWWSFKLTSFKAKRSSGPSRAKQLFF